MSLKQFHINFIAFILLCFPISGKAQLTSISINFFDFLNFKQTSELSDTSLKIINKNRNITPYLGINYLLKSRKSAINFGIGYSKPHASSSSGNSYLSDYRYYETSLKSNQLFTLIGISQTITDGQKIQFRLNFNLPVSIFLNQVKNDSNIAKNITNNRLLYSKSTKIEYPTNYLFGLYVTPNLTYKISSKLGIKIEQSFGISLTQKKGKSIITESNLLSNNTFSKSVRYQNENFTYLNYRSFFTIGIVLLIQKKSEKVINN